MPSFPLPSAPETLCEPCIFVAPAPAPAPVVQDGVLLVTPTSEGLDAAVADGFAVRGLHKLEIR